MQLFSSIFALTILLTSQQAFSAAKIDPALAGFMHGDASQTALVLAVLDTPSSFTDSKPSRYDSRNVLLYLRARTKAAWEATRLGLTQDASLQLTDLYWINASAALRVTPEGLKTLAATPGVKKIYANHRIFFDKPMSGGHLSDSLQRQAGYDFAETALDQLIKEAPSITGKGVVVGSVDTGVDGKHPALAGKIALFYDSAKKKVTDPYDSDSHGSHTVGTMLGGDRGQNMIGMAPDAKVIASGPLNDYNGMLRSMQFMLDPDGNPNTKDMPRAINNSWNCGGAPDIEIFYKAVSAWEAAGILPVFSAGNAGPGAGTITPPHEHPAVIAIGATGPGGKIASFSSRGPGRYHGQETQKPDITAPGVDINSSIPGGRYGTMSGTSMAAPHVTGAVALLLQVEPTLNPTQLRKVLVKTATPAKSEAEDQGWNPVYGFGRMNVYSAAKMAKEIRDAIRGVAAIDLIGALLKSPHALDIAEILESGQPTSADFDYPATLESNDWM